MAAPRRRLRDESGWIDRAGIDGSDFLRRQTPAEADAACDALDGPKSAAYRYLLRHREPEIPEGNAPPTLERESRATAYASPILRITENCTLSLVSREARLRLHLLEAHTQRAETRQRVKRARSSQKAVKEKRAKRAKKTAAQKAASPHHRRSAVLSPTPSPPPSARRA